jgi:hypothetical protein
LKGFSIVAALILSLAPAIAARAFDGKVVEKQFCENFAGAAQEVMRLRQDDAPISEVSKVTAPMMDANTITEIAQYAWKIPVRSNNDERNAEISGFTDAQHARCVKEAADLGWSDF